jgi:hypothetical protein
MLKYNPQPFQKRVADFSIVNYPRINQEKIIDPDFSYQNKGCAQNAVTAYKCGRADAVWLVMAGNLDHVVVHFINSKNGKYFDETWGTKTCFYFCIRKVNECEMDNIHDLLNATKRNFYALLGSWLDKKYFDEDCAI